MALAKLETADLLERALHLYDLLKTARDHELTSTPNSLAEAMASLEQWIEDLEDAQDLEEADEIEADLKRNGTVPWDHVKKDLGL